MLIFVLVMAWMMVSHITTERIKFLEHQVRFLNDKQVQLEFRCEDLEIDQ